MRLCVKEIEITETVEGILVSWEQFWLLLQRLNYTPPNSKEGSIEHKLAVQEWNKLSGSVSKSIQLVQLVDIVSRVSVFMQNKLTYQNLRSQSKEKKVVQRSVCSTLTNQLAIKSRGKMDYVVYIYIFQVDQYSLFQQYEQNRQERIRLMQQQKKVELES